MNIQDALKNLDPANDDHWTMDGAPRVDVVAGLIENQNITRADITNAAPDFTRQGQSQAAQTEGGNNGVEAHTEAKPEAEATEEVAKAGIKPGSDPDKAEAAKPGEGAEDAAPAEPEAQEGVATEPVEDGVHDLTMGPAPEEETDPDAGDDPAEAEAEAARLAGEADPEPDPEPAPAPAPEPQEPPTKLEALQTELGIATTEMYEAQGVHEAAKKFADKKADEVNALNRKIEVLQKRDPNHGTAAIRAYLEQQNKNRLARAAGMRRFLSETGMHPKDVVNAVDPKAPIDRAMSTRKPAMGSQRPVYQRR